MEQPNRPWLDTFAFKSRILLKRRNQSFGTFERTPIPCPASLSDEVDPITTNVQIAIEDRAYAEELRDLLEEDNERRAYIVDTPNPAMDGVIVLDETALGHVGVLERTEALRYIVLGKESTDFQKLWEAGIRCVVPANYLPILVRAAVAGVELRVQRERTQKR